MLKDVQKAIRKQFFDFLGTGTTKIQGKGLQGKLAQAWGKLQALFEDDEIESVFFVNQLDVADYLESAQISTQTAFGMLVQLPRRGFARGRSAADLHDPGI